MTTNLQTLKAAAAALESTDAEYSLQALVLKSKLSRDVVASLLKKHWIDEDRLKIVNLELTIDEEAALYDQ